MSKGNEAKKTKKSSADIDAIVDEISNENILAHSIKFYEGALSKAFEEQGQFLVHELVTKLQNAPIGNSISAASEGEGEGEWVQVESLSRLRSVVGGRFQNIKKKWMDAGFPLREHRGDKEANFSIDERGWIELTNWIIKQGFESRLAPPGAPYLFELKAVIASSKK